MQFRSRSDDYHGCFPSCRRTPGMGGNSVYAHWGVCQLVPWGTAGRSWSSFPVWLCRPKDIWLAVAVVAVHPNGVRDDEAQGRAGRVVAVATGAALGTRSPHHFPLLLFVDALSGRHRRQSHAYRSSKRDRCAEHTPGVWRFGKWRRLKLAVSGGCFQPLAA
jgi:hypothetical protein